MPRCLVPAHALSRVDVSAEQLTRTSAHAFALAHALPTPLIAEAKAEAARLVAGAAARRPLNVPVPEIR